MIQTFFRNTPNCREKGVPARNPSLLSPLSSWGLRISATGKEKGEGSQLMMMWGGLSRRKGMEKGRQEDLFYILSISFGRMGSGSTIIAGSPSPLRREVLYKC